VRPTQRLELSQLPSEDPSGIDFLSSPVEWMRYCPVCQKESRFVADRICASGLIGNCSGCGDERIAAFTRTNAEGAA